MNSVVDPDPDPVGSGSGSRINSFGSGSDQAQFGMNFIPNFSVKINVFSTECGKKVLCFNFILHPNVNILGIKCVYRTSGVIFFIDYCTAYATHRKRE